MKKGLFIVFAFILIAACKKDDPEPATPQPSAYPKETKLKGYTYTNERIVILGNDFTADLKRECDYDNDFNFIDSGRVLITDNGIICPNSTGSWKTSTKSWRMLDSNSMYYFGRNYTISFSSTQLVLTEIGDPTSYTTLDIK